LRKEQRVPMGSLSHIDSVFHKRTTSAFLS
jgi:hypothetical protein